MPDYVFGDGYVLITPDSVEKHINEQGHLPLMPSSKTVVKEGIEIGDITKNYLNILKIYGSISSK